MEKVEKEMEEEDEEEDKEVGNIEEDEKKGRKPKEEEEERKENDMELEYCSASEEFEQRNVITLPRLWPIFPSTVLTLRL